MEAGSQLKDGDPGEVLSRVPIPDQRANADAKKTHILAGIKIACFYPWTPFEPGGAWSRFQNYVEFLLERGASVILCVSGYGENLSIGRASVRYICRKPPYNAACERAGMLLRSQEIGELRKLGQEQLARILLFQTSFYKTLPQLMDAADSVVADCDIVSCEYPMMAGTLAELCKKHSKPLIVTGHDVMSAAFATHSFAVAQIQAAEVAAYKSADANFFCVESDQRHFADHGVAGVTVMTTGRVPPRSQKKNEALRRDLEASNCGDLRIGSFVLLVGSPHGPNVEAALELKKLAKLLPKFQCVVAGGCHSPVKEGNFIALGQVSDRCLDALYASCLAVVIPLRQGTGISVKTFEAFSRAKAVVSTAVGARGFRIESKRQYLSAETLEEFAAQIRALSSDHLLRERIENAAYDFARTLDCRNLFWPYEEAIRNLVQNGSALSTGSPAKLWLVDNKLTDTAGHHYNYALSLSHACSELGVPFRVLANQSLAVGLQESISAEAVFSSSIHERAISPFPERWGQLSEQYNLLQGAVVFGRDLEMAIQRGVAAGDKIFVPNANPEQILAIAALIERFPVLRFVEFILLLRYTMYAPVGPLAQRKIVPDATAISRHRIAIERLMEVKTAPRIRWTTDSEPLATEYEELFGIHCEVLPIPHTHQAESKGSELVPPKSPEVKRVVFLGDAREEKGVELLPALAKGWPRSGPLASVEFVIQAVITSSYHTPMAEHLEAIVKAAHPSFKLITRVLAPADYNCLLGSADLVLLPYDAGTYKGRTSGPFMEALCAGKPVVIPKGTWMQHVLADSDAGGVFQTGNPADLLKTTAAVIQELERHRIAAERFGRSLKEVNNPISFIRSIMGERFVSPTP